MTIEIADRLIQLRKKHGYSQEELADKLGLSRQAVSKWERAEASPDTDNLICLAKIYGVSLDELLSTDEDVETIVKEQVKDKEGGSSIKLEDDEGNKVYINKSGAKCYTKDGKEVEKHHIMSKEEKIIGAIEGCLFLFAIVAYICLGALLGMWHNMWILVFVPDIICSIVRCIVKKNANKFNMAFTACFVFFFVTMVYPTGLWHPMWVVFLAIPVYHTLMGTVNKIMGKSDEDEEDEEDEKE